MKMKAAGFVVLGLAASAQLCAQTNTFPSSGNVGIGTTTPASLLSVSSADSYHAPILVDRAYDGARLRLTYGGSSTASELGMTWFSSGHIWFWLGANLDSTGSSHVSTPVQEVSTAPSWLQVFDTYNDCFQIKRIAPGGSPTPLVHVANSGNVGMGTTNPGAKLEVAADYSGLPVNYGTTQAYSALRVTSSGTNAVLDFGVNSGYGAWLQYSNKTDLSHVYPILLNPLGGNVGIGTTNPDPYALAVNGTIRAKEIVVDTGWSDYVFSKGYRLAPLSEVEAHITKEGHLPNVPSAKEVAERGISVGEMQAKLLAKIEELTLHQIAQAKELQSLRVRVSDQDQEIERLRAEVHQ